MASTYTKTCPDCGAINDSNDLFCKDCGTSLAMVADSSQQTSSFTPIAPANGTQTTALAPAATPYTPQYVPTSVPEQPNYGYMPEEESSRGAVLGWLAATLMLIIVAAFIWSAVISESTRDRITGIF